MKCLQSCRARSGLLVYSSPAILPPGLQRRLRATGYGAGNCLSRPLSSPAPVLARAFPPVHPSPSSGTFPHSPVWPLRLWPLPPRCRTRMWRASLSAFSLPPCHILHDCIPPSCVFTYRQVHEQRHRVSLQVELCPFIIHHV